MINALNKMINGIKTLYAKLSNYEMSREEAAALMERFVEGRCIDDYEWRDFLDYGSKDPEVEKARDEIWEIWTKHTKSGGKDFCDEKGKQRVREIANSLRTETAT